MPKYSFEHFLLRYYPTPDDIYFNNFSYYERKFRLQKEFFTEYGVPTLEAKMYMPKSFFTIGELDYYIEFINEKDMRLSIRAQKYYIEKRAEGIRDREKIIVKPGGVDRRVPGWELAWKLYKSIIKAYIDYFDADILLAIEIEKPGKVYTTKGGEIIKEDDSQEAAEKYIEIGFTVRQDLPVNYRAYTHIYEYYSRFSEENGYVFRNLLLENEICKLLNLKKQH